MAGGGEQKLQNLSFFSQPNRPVAGDQFFGAGRKPIWPQSHPGAIAAAHRRAHARQQIGEAQRFGKPAIGTGVKADAAIAGLSGGVKTITGKVSGDRQLAHSEGALGAAGQRLAPPRRGRRRRRCGHRRGP